MSSKKLFSGSSISVAEKDEANSKLLVLACNSISQSFSFPFKEKMQRLLVVGQWSKQACCLKRWSDSMVKWNWIVSKRDNEIVKYLIQGKSGIEADFREICDLWAEQMDIKWNENKSGCDKHREKLKSRRQILYHPQTIRLLLILSSISYQRKYCSYISQKCNFIMITCICPFKNWKIKGNFYLGHTHLQVEKCKYLLLVPHSLF